MQGKRTVLVTKPKHSATPPPCKCMHQNFAVYSEMLESLKSNFHHKEITGMRFCVWASQQCEGWMLKKG